MLDADGRAPHPARLDDATLLKQCDVRRTRRSGPGGQHRNKVETAVVLRHSPSGIQAEAGERRSQPENLHVAVRRLRIKLALEIRCPVAANAPPSPLWQNRCRGGRLSISPSHDDFPALLAEALDVVHAHDGDVKAAAAQLGCTPTQLVKLLKIEPEGLALLNAQRADRGLPPLK